MAAKHQRSSFFLNSGLYDGLSRFSELEQRIEQLPTSREKGEAFEVFAEAFLSTQKLAQSRNVWPFAALPLSIARNLLLDTGRDMGVDGVIETPIGQYDAYQVKFRSGRPRLTWDELSTFMGLTDRVNQRILFTNCDDFPALMNDRTGFFCIRGSDLDRLERRDFEAIRQWLASGIAEVVRKQPLPHQSEALDAILPVLSEQPRATTVMACGTGKTLVALWTAERMRCKSVVVLLPSLSLVRQTLHEWLRETSWPELSFLCVCSDPSVSKGADSVIVQQSDLDFSVTTDAGEIRQFLAADFAGVRLIFSTYQSAHLVGEAMVGHPPFDFGIFDEAHKTTGREGAKFGFALNDANLAIDKRLFMTATPRHYNINKRNKEGDATLVYSMDATDVYGPVAHRLSFAEAAKREIICDYKVVISVVTSEMVGRELIRKGEVLVDGDTVKAQQVASQIAIGQAAERYGVSRIFSFHASVASARSFTSDKSEGIGAHLPEFGAFHVNGAMPTAAREHVMKAFADADQAIMSNARCLTEGVDVPAVDMVAFMSPRKSKVDIVQATGRAMRKSPNKAFGFVLIPLFLETEKDETIEEALERTGMEDIWNVLQAMQEQDEELVDIIRQMREDKGRTGGFDDSRLREKIETLGPVLSLATLQNSISAACVDRLGVTWDERYGELKAYKERYGDSHVPSTWPENPQLASWVANQRTIRKRGTLAQERITLLDAIDFEWNWLEASWNKMFEQLVEYKNTYGDCLVPKRGGENPELGIWVTTQRHNKRNNALPSERIQMLNEVGFDWDVADTQWENMFHELSDYKMEHGHCDVPKRSKNHPKLASWVNNQRTRYKRGMLDNGQIARLNALGFQWTPKDQFWEQMFHRLVEYKERFGHCNVPNVWNENKQLGSWVQAQRQARKRGELPQEKCERLESIGFIWSSYDTFWEEMFQSLLEYKEAHGDCNVPQRWEKNRQLGNWISAQRSEYKRKAIGKERIQKLEEAGFIWNALDAKWEEMFSALAAYKEANGNLRIPSNNEALTELCRWVGTQRYRRKQEKLDENRVNKLDSIGFEW